jgi:hypothetical protein
MTATSQRDPELSVEGKTLKDIYKKLCRMLSVSGPRVLKVETEHGAVICTSLYDGDSFIKDKNGRMIYSS